LTTVLISTLDFRDCGDLFKKYRSILPESIIERYHHFLKIEDKHRYLVGKLLTLACFEEQYKLTDLKYGKYGKPYVTGGINFNVSHSYEYVVLAFSKTTTVGIDIVKTLPKTMSQFRNYFSEMEWRSIYLNSNPHGKFFEYWTIKESVSKAAGFGLNIPFNEIAIENGQTAIFRRKQFYFQEIEVAPNYSCFVANGFAKRNIKVVHTKNLLELETIYECLSNSE